jgi:hypothetical protein
VNVAETVNAKVAASNMLAFLTVTFVEDLAASSVTVKPPSIIASSAATGADAPGAPPEVADQVAVEIHVPLATENLCAADARTLIMSTQNAAAKTKPSFFIKAS